MGMKPYFSKALKPMIKYTNSPIDLRMTAQIFKAKHILKCAESGPKHLL